MLYPSINLLKTKVDSRYTLVIMAAKRARDILEGKPKLIEIDSKKPVSIATWEIAEDLISYKRVEAKAQSIGEGSSIAEAEPSEEESIEISAVEGPESSEISEAEGGEPGEPAAAGEAEEEETPESETEEAGEETPEPEAEEGEKAEGPAVDEDEPSEPAAEEEEPEAE